MKLHGGRVVDAGEASPEREAEMRQVVDRVTRWSANRSDVVGLLLVGSCARGAVRPDSDVDFVLLSTATDRYADDDGWARELSLGALVRVQAWGPITERRYVTDSGLEVEMGVGSPDWARADPVDDGTRRVVTDGARPLYDPAGILRALIQACV
ncbi:nucleotidyltransferase domain-containing protein [Streptomyces sp. NPDC051677]|uniref:nucleotidyltransferase domain-containing protein n=1 Tax=Streptomyces sp. NPDC051677 TaxID=3365669 RepID=UPI0037D5B3FE